MEDGFGFLKGDTHLGSGQVFSGHHRFHLLVQIRLKSQIPVGDDTHQIPLLDHGYPGNPVLAHDLQDIIDLPVRFYGDGVYDHATLRFLDLFHLQGLPLHTHVFVDKTESSLSCYGNSCRRFGHGVHGGTHDRNI